MEFVQNHFWLLLLVANYLVALVTAVFILLHNRHPISTLSYILSLIVFPFVGLFFYYFLGREYRKNKMFQRKKVFDHQKIKQWEKKMLLSEQSLDRYEADFLEEKVKMVKLIQHDQKNPLTFNNQLQLLLNGEEKFEALFADIERAEKHVHLEYYIFDTDKIGTKMMDLLCEKAKEGVRVRLSYDDVGSSLRARSLKKLKQNGVEVFPFLPVRFPKLTRKFNFRNHRKIAVIDGKIGYVGGINISDDYLNPPGKKVFWRDTHLRIFGDAVKTLQSYFLLNWNFVSKQEIQIRNDYFPKIDPRRQHPVQISASGPDSYCPHIMETLLSAIHSAEDHVYIETPYFIPNDEILTAMKIVARRGTVVKLMLPAKSDSRIIDRAGQSYLLPLMESGVEVYFYQKGFLHSKLMIVDGLFSTLGSSNLDYRSFEINLEINALLYSAQIARQMTKIFAEDLKNCEQVDPQQWQKRSFPTKLTESLCRLWAPLL